MDLHDLRAIKEVEGAIHSQFFRGLFDFYKMDIPKTLYHYTSAQGLLGILQSSEIFAGNTLFLNDDSEIKHATRLVKKEFKLLKNEFKDDPECRRDII